MREFDARRMAAPTVVFFSGRSPKRQTAEAAILRTHRALFGDPRQREWIIVDMTMNRRTKNARAQRISECGCGNGPMHRKNT